MLGGVVPQDRFAKPARTAMDQHDQLLIAQTDLLELATVDYFLNRLEFGEVISTSEGAQRFIELRGFEFLFSKNFIDSISPDVLEVERDLSPAVQLYVTAD